MRLETLIHPAFEFGEYSKNSNVAGSEAAVALFRGSVVRVWDHRRLMVPVQWAQRLQVVRVEQRAGLVLVVRPALTGQRLQQGRRLLVDPDDAVVAGWRPTAPCSARLVGCGDCVLIAAHVDPPAVAPSADDVLRRLDEIEEWVRSAPSSIRREALAEVALRGLCGTSSS